MASDESTAGSAPGKPGITDVEPVSIDVQPEYDANGVRFEVVDRNGALQDHLRPQARFERGAADHRRGRAPARLGGTMNPVVLIVPNGKRATRVELPREVALWLRDQLSEAVGAPKPRRRVKLRRGRWREGRP